MCMSNSFSTSLEVGSRGFLELDTLEQFSDIPIFLYKAREKEREREKERKRERI